jgi:hypothetical protein
VVQINPPHLPTAKAIRVATASHASLGPGRYMDHHLDKFACRQLGIHGSCSESSVEAPGWADCARAGLGDELDAQAAEQSELRYSWLQSSG